MCLVSSGDAQTPEPPTELLPATGAPGAVAELLALAQRARQEGADLILVTLGRAPKGFAALLRPVPATARSLNESGSGSPREPEAAGNAHRSLRISDTFPRGSESWLGCVFWGFRSWVAAAMDEATMAVHVPYLSEKAETGDFCLGRHGATRLRSSTFMPIRRLRPRSLLRVSSIICHLGRKGAKDGQGDARIRENFPMPSLEF